MVDNKPVKMLAYFESETFLLPKSRSQVSPIVQTRFDLASQPGSFSWREEPSNIWGWGGGKSSRLLLLHCYIMWFPLGAPMLSNYYVSSGGPHAGLFSLRTRIGKCSAAVVFVMLYYCIFPLPFLVWGYVRSKCDVPRICLSLSKRCWTNMDMLRQCWTSWSRMLVGWTMVSLLKSEKVCWGFHHLCEQT